MLTLPEIARIRYLLHRGRPPHPRSCRPPSYAGMNSRMPRLTGPRIEI